MSPLFSQMPSALDPKQAPAAVASSRHRTEDERSAPLGMGRNGPDASPSRPEEHRCRGSSRRHARSERPGTLPLSEGFALALLTPLDRGPSRSADGPSTRFREGSRGQPGASLPRTGHRDVPGPPSPSPADGGSLGSTSYRPRVVRRERRRDLAGHPPPHERSRHGPSKCCRNATATARWKYCPRSLANARGCPTLSHVSRRLPLSPSCKSAICCCIIQTR